MRSNDGNRKKQLAYLATTKKRKERNAKREAFKEELKRLKYHPEIYDKKSVADIINWVLKIGSLCA